MILVTGGAGFIGSNFVTDWLAGGDEPVVNLDLLTYAGNLQNLAAVSADPRHRFVRGDISDRDLITRLLTEGDVRAVVHFAAESHVDRSIHGPEAFIDTNVVGTFRLLEAARAHWANLPADRRDAFRFLHVSTDEVYGSLAPTDPPFAETNPYQPNSPYSASKAASDHLVRSYHHTYGLPVVTTNCSNNYGPRQFPEKLIPLCIHNALARRAGEHRRGPRPVRDPRPRAAPGRRSLLCDADRVCEGPAGARSAVCDRRPQSGPRARLEPGGNLRHRHRAHGPLVPGERGLGGQRDERRLP